MSNNIDIHLFRVSSVKYNSYVIIFVLIQKFKFLAFKVLYCLQKCPYFLESDIKTMYHCLVSSHLFVISLVFTNNRPDRGQISSDNLFVITSHRLQPKPQIDINMFLRDIRCMLMWWSKVKQKLTRVVVMETIFMKMIPSYRRQGHKY